MKEEHVPYIIFLPPRHNDQIVLLTSVFGSKIKLEILNEFCFKEEIYQKDLIEKFPYSNKTLITHLKELVTLKILNEKMVKKEGKWLKMFNVNDSMRWLVLLLRDPDTIPREEMKKIITRFLNDYVKSILKISEHYGMDKKEIQRFLSDIYEDSR
ncbi:MAG: hypothetical protein KAV48_00695 [Methanomicrobia archaeon]|nr:hypothetical protein [Methanomicrobia archaeon]